jgi:hypothetical protein
MLNHYNEYFVYGSYTSKEYEVIYSHTKIKNTSKLSLKISESSDGINFIYYYKFAKQLNRSLTIK